MLNETRLSLEVLLNTLGYEMWEHVLNIFILVPVNLMGIVLCSFSLWIFSRSSFEDEIFFYYRLLCFVNIIHLIHNVPACLLFSPYYIPMLNTYLISLFQIYYNTLSFFLLHYENVLQMGILLHKMKFFSSFVRRHFIARPQIVSLAFFITCLLIDIPISLSFKTTPMGNYFYFDANGEKEYSTLYSNTSSDFSKQAYGRILLGITIFFLHFLLSFLVGVTLNIFSYIKYKSYMNKRNIEVTELEMSSINNRPTISRELEQMKHKERFNLQLEKNMLYMALTLCFISIVSCAIFMASYFYFFYFYSFSNSLILKTLINSLSTFVPTVSIFVFYAFNTRFRDETNTFLRFGVN